MRLRDPHHVAARPIAAPRSTVRYPRWMAANASARGPVISGQVLEFVIEHLRGFGIDGRACAASADLTWPNPLPRHVPLSNLYGLW